MSGWKLDRLLGNRFLLVEQVGDPRLAAEAIPTFESID